MALCAIIHLPSLFWALGLDQNIFAEIGSLLLHGKKLYVDAWDVKPPNVFYIYAFFEWLFGPHTFAVRASDYVAAMFACAAVYTATARQTKHISRTHSEWIAPLASILLILTLLSLGLADTAQTESYSLVFLIGAGVLLSPGEKEHSTFAIFAAGALIAIATFFKTTNAVFLIAVAIEVLLSKRQLRVRSFLILLAGFLLWTALQIGVLAWQFSLSEYLRISWGVVLHHPNEVSQLSIGDLPRAVWTYVDLWSILVIIAITIAILKRDGPFLRSVRLPLLLLTAGIVAVVAQNKGWGYQYVILLPGLVPLAANAAIYLYQISRERSRMLALSAVIIVTLATLFVTPSARRRIHYTEDAIQSIRDHPAYLATLGAKRSLYYPPCTDSLANYLASNTKPTEEVFIFGEEPGAYWRANRMPASKFVYTLLFTSGVIPESDLRAMQDTLAQKQPDLIAIERFDTTAFRHRPETSESLVVTDPLFQSLRALIAKQYAPPDTLYEKFLIYKRK